MATELIYLASPYSDPDPAVREQRYDEVCKSAARLIELGKMVYAPIAHSHGIAKHGDLPFDWEFWGEYDRRMLTVCDLFCILTIPGWSRSVGLMEEKKLAEFIGKPTVYVRPYHESLILMEHPNE